jgi:predicted RNase H-like nuclease (RuvC/YqgF family)
MDVRLQNAYVEVLLDNFVSVIKQNIMFQAQLEVMNKNVNEADETKRKIAELSASNIELQKLVDNLTGENNTLKTNVDNSQLHVATANSIREEKARLQAAVNDYMKQNKTLTTDLAKFKSEVEEQNKYIAKLEELVPLNKLRKLRKVDITEFVEKAPEIDNVKSGGTF